MLKIAKNGLILHWVDSFGFSQIFLASSPPPIRFHPRRGPKILSSPHQKFRDKTLVVIVIVSNFYSTEKLHEVHVDKLNQFKFSLYRKVP